MRARERCMKKSEARGNIECIRPKSFMLKKRMHVDQSFFFSFPYSAGFCKFANALPGSNVYCSTLTICAMAIDRYANGGNCASTRQIAFAFSFYTVRRMSLSGAEDRWRTIIFALTIWLVSFVLSLPLLIYYDVSMLYAFEVGGRRLFVEDVFCVFMAAVAAAKFGVFRMLSSTTRQQM